MFGVYGAWVNTVYSRSQHTWLIDPDFSYLKLLAVHSFRVCLKSPSDPETKEGLLEGLLNVDGEIHHLGATEFEARCRPGLVQLYHCIPSDNKKGAS
ncbi:hypothetical protein CHS0354_015388 [Potamilus streckersoni]|uniref:Uncharacterized protein n=1 Tax=Potamilus streckersoni TaxID=2493646 RepID=A0AAE0S115_9BIVA|nr:hypothetical protein CHS0354_015388 [Potamilus streckersoni]